MKPMETIQEVRAYFERQLQYVYSPDAPDRLMAEVLQKLADKCQTVEEFVEKAQQIPVTGAGIEQVDIANEYREIALETIQHGERL